MTNRLSPVLRMFGTGLLYIVAALLLFLLVNKRALSVQSNSMVPTFQKGDLVLVQKEATYKVGDIITFVDRNNPKKTITHRLISISVDGLLQTKGDANPIADQPIAPKQVIGKVSLTVPYAGYLREAGRHPVGLLVLIYMPSLIILYRESRRLIRHFKQYQRWEDVATRSKIRLQTHSYYGLIALLAIFLQVSVQPTQAALSASTTLRSNFVGAIMPRSICAFPSYEHLLSYAEMDAYFPELPDKPIPLDTPITPGDYTINAMSLDSHHESPYAGTQADERWAVWFYDTQGNIVTKTNFTDDLPDNLVTNTTTVAEQLTFASEAVAIRYVHISAVNGLEIYRYNGRDFDNLSLGEKQQVIWNSIQPGCITYYEDSAR